MTYVFEWGRPRHGDWTSYLELAVTADSHAEARDKVRKALEAAAEEEDGDPGVLYLEPDVGGLKHFCVALRPADVAEEMVLDGEYENG